MIQLETNERFLKRFEHWTIALLIGLTVASYLVAGRWQVPLSVLIGGVLALVNFRSMQRDVKSMAQAIISGAHTARRAAQVYLLKCYLRLGATAIVLYFVIKRQIVHPVPLIWGISVVMVNILLCALAKIGRNVWLKFKEG